MQSLKSLTERNLKFIYAYSNLGLKALLGPITTILILLCFSRYEQGIYYILLSTLGILQIAELGFQNIILNEADKSSYDENSRSELDVNLLRSVSNINLIKWSTVYFFMVGLIFAITISVFFVFFYQLENFYTVFFVSLACNLISFIISPYISIIEGTGFVKHAFKIRTILMVVIALITVGYIYIFKNVYIIAISSLGTLLFNLYFLNRTFGLKTLGTIRRADFTNAFIWLKNRFTFQLKISISYLLGQFTYSFYQMIIFKHISVEAVGRFGISYTIFSFIASVISLFSTVKFSEISNLYFKLDFEGVKENFKKDFLRITIHCFVILPLTIAGYFFIQYCFPAKIDRLVDFQTFAIFLVGIVFSSLVNLIAQYTRANNTELMFWHNIFFAVLHYMLIFILILEFGILGISIAYLTSYFVLYILYRRTFNLYLMSHDRHLYQ